MSNGQKPADTLHDNAIGWGIMLAIIAVLLWLFWLYFDHDVRNMVRWLRYSEMWLVSWFVGNDYEVTFENNPLDFHVGFDAAGEYEKGKMGYRHLAMFSALAMQPLRGVIVFILGLGALWAMFQGPRTQYRRKIDLEGLISTQSSVFPVVSPFVKFNPSTQPPRPPGAPVPAELPLFAEALGPEEWLAYNNINVPNGIIEGESAARAFRKQLGKPWRGARNLDPYKRILLAAFCLKAARKRNDSDQMLGQLAQCWEFSGGLKLNKKPGLLKQADAVLGNKELAGSTLAQCNRHAYETTALIRALQFAREEGGVLAPATFVWLRAHDRDLWYPLNNVGRQSFHMEAMGAMSHFKAEKITQRPIPRPKVDGAVQTISEYMKSSRARPIPQLDYSQSKKSGVKKAV